MLLYTIFIQVMSWLSMLIWFHVKIFTKEFYKKEDYCSSLFKVQFISNFFRYDTFSSRFLKVNVSWRIERQIFFSKILELFTTDAFHVSEFFLNVNDVTIRTIVIYSSGYPGFRNKVRDNNPRQQRRVGQCLG